LAATLIRHCFFEIAMYIKRKFVSQEYSENMSENILPAGD
jgi:hypothetical protein